MFTLALAAIQSSRNDGLTFGEILADLPADPASIFVIALFLGSITLVLWAGRPRGGRGGHPA